MSSTMATANSSNAMLEIPTKENKMRKSNDIIVVVAGNRDQFQYWLRHNVISITSKDDINKLRGIKIEQVYYEGTYYEWFDREIDLMLHYLKERYTENSNEEKQP